MADRMLEVSDSEFESMVLGSDLPIVVDFWAPWCGPCKMIAPIMAELAQEYAGQMTFAKMDIAQHPLTATKYGIRSIPALIFFKQGQVAEYMMGAQSKEKIKDKIQKVI